MKMKPLLYLFLSLISLAAISQSDVINTEKGDLKITPVNHGSLALEIADKVIFIDPYGGGEKYTGFASPDLILITDIHGDHLNMSTLNAIDTKEAVFVVPQAVADQIKDSFTGQVKVLNNGEMSQWFDIEIKAIPMYNLPESADAPHTKGRGNGYVLSIGGKKVYISGDTEDIPEMRNLKGIDVAFVCMNLPYTMDINQAASAVIDFSPGIVYPYHYRGKDGLSDVAQFKTLVNKGNSRVDVRLRDWYPE